MAGPTGWLDGRVAVVTGAGTGPYAGTSSAPFQHLLSLQRRFVR